ncbi:MAG: ABC transporter ATP-binding protein, partial [Acutalibacteraceae bacterium]
MLKRFVKYYKKYLGLFIADMSAAIAVAVMNLCYPVITRKLINEYIPDGNLRAVVILCLILLGVYILNASLNYFIQYYGHMVGTRMQADMRNDLFSHMQRLPIKFFDNNKTGALMSRITGDLFDVSELAHHGPEDLFLSVILLVGSFILMSRINLTLTLIVFAGIPVLIAFAAFKRLKMSKAFGKMR